MAAGSRIGRALRRVSGAGGARPAKAVAAPTKAGGKAAKKIAKPAKKATPATKSTAKKAPAAKSSAKKAAPAAKSTAKKAAPAAKSSTKKAAPAARSTAKKAAKTAAKKATATKARASKAPATKAAPEKTPVKKAAASKTAPAKRATPVKKAPATAGGPARVSVPAGSDWTRAELTAIRAQLVDELAEMRAAYDRSLADLTELQLSSGDGAGDDQADAGSKTFEREQEQSIAANRLDLMTQMQHAVERIDAGTYGYCESCGRPIPKARLKAFPAATLDVACKEREERR
jgi:RNA polymerase-binding transcription factor DksA